MKMKRRVVAFGVALVSVFLVSSEAMAASKIAYICWEGMDFSGNRSVCVADLDGSNVVSLPNPAGVDYTASPDLDVTADGTEVLLQTNGSIHRIPIDGSPATSVALLPSPSEYAGVAFFTAPPSVATLTPTNQTITVFLLGMIASALIMRRRVT
jgi:hypothetical protein